MNDIKKIFKAIKSDNYRPSATSYFDPVRKYFVPKTPEEEVRQKQLSSWKHNWEYLLIDYV